MKKIYFSPTERYTSSNYETFVEELINNQNAIIDWIEQHESRKEELYICPRCNKSVCEGSHSCVI